MKIVLICSAIRCKRKQPCHRGALIHFVPTPSNLLIYEDDYNLKMIENVELSRSNSMDIIPFLNMIHKKKYKTYPMGLQIYN